MLFQYESDNLIYEILLQQDAPKILDFYYTNREQFEPYEPNRPNNFYTLEYQETMAKIEYESFLRSKGARYWISRKSQPGIIIGCVSFSNVVKGSFQSASIGYKIHKNHQRMGYGSEAVSFLCKQAFESGEFHRIEACIHPDNAPSIALAQKCGFTYEGIARGYVYMGTKWVDHLRYSIISH